MLSAVVVAMAGLLRTAVPGVPIRVVETPAAGGS
jgi:hypothetical protein